MIVYWGKGRYLEDYWILIFRDLKCYYDFFNRERVIGILDNRVLVKVYFLVGLLGL